MNLELLASHVEQIRERAIGVPAWLESKRVFEYPSQSLEVVVLLKLVRAVQGVNAMDLLCRAGLFIDMGAIYRCVSDCISEIYFLLERYPDQSPNAVKFIREFFSRTIDNHLSSNEDPVPTKKIHAAVTRSLSGSEQDEATRQILTRIHKSFSGYTHASYAHIMQMYGGPTIGNLSFNLAGISSQTQIEKNMNVVEELYVSLVYAAAYVAKTLGFPELDREIMECR